MNGKELKQGNKCMYFGGMLTENKMGKPLGKVRTCKCGRSIVAYM